MIGTSVGPYRILEQLGQGGMGIVYKAHDDRLDRIVALKFLPPQLSADHRAQERFVQEAKAASALDHANICTIHDIGQTDEGRVYIVMAYYEGQTLKYRLDEGGLPLDEVVDIVRQMARGLARAHEAGIVHRDIKPANVMLTDRGEVKILDFGLAKLATSADLTKEGSTIGTAAYMSPEQSRGETVDGRSDLWSLGVVAYELLTGKRPFGGGYDAAMLYAILNEEAAPADRLNPEVPASVARVVDRCLVKDPGGRFASVNAFLNAFEAAAGGSHGSGPVPAGTPASSVPARATTGRLLAGFGVATVAALAVVWSAMHFFGLPDWVFTAGVVLMLAGLPIVMVAGWLERRRDAMDSGERRLLSGIPAWLTVRRAVLGGGLSMSLLAVASAGWMAMRALGIGPAGTLVSTGAFDESDFVVMGEFENRTQDANLGTAITEAFRIDLSQSSVVSLVELSRVREALVLMQRSAQDPLVPDVARQVAIRTGAKAFIVGDISSVGRSYVLAARLVSAGDGTELVAIRENAEDDGAILAAVDRLSGKLRERIGESLIDIRGGQPLEDVTTTSLEALWFYSDAVALADRGEYLEAERLLVQALAVDSMFAMAWRKLAVVQDNADRPVASYHAATQRAYDLRDRLTERERLLTEALYYNYIVPDVDQLIVRYRDVLAKWPNDLVALNNLGNAYRSSTKRMYAESEELARRAVALGEGINFRQGLIGSLALLGKWEETERELDASIEKYPDESGQWVWKARIAAKRGDHEAAAANLDSAEVRIRDDADRSYLETTRSNFADLFGHYGEAERYAREEARENVEQGFEASLFFFEMVRMWQRANIGLDSAPPSRAVFDDILARYPLDENQPRYRPWPLVAATEARFGNPDRADELMAKWEADVPAAFRGPNPVRAALAMIAESRGDLQSALAQLDSARTDDNCPDCYWNLQAQFFERADSVQAAIAAWERVLSADFGFAVTLEEGPTRYHLGNLYDRAGDPDKAIENYARFVDLWKTADPDLQPYVRDAQAELDRLLRESAREPSPVPSAPGS